jgi:hypothetical protein
MQRDKLNLLKAIRGCSQGVTKRCRLSWLTNSALVYDPKCLERRGGGELRGLSQRVQLYTGAQINLGDLTPYLTCKCSTPIHEAGSLKRNTALEYSTRVVQGRGPSM